jgi:ribosome-associated toxin RatA of RatAB toxin-antitoxin module
VRTREIGLCLTYRSASFALLVLVPAVCAAQDVSVKVQRHGDTIVVDVEATVAAPVRDAWSVFTDYDHMSSFISNIKQSRVIARKGNSLEVEQSGETKVAFLHFGFAAVRAVELVPMQEIRSSLVSGDFKAYSSTTRVAATPSGVQISHHGEYVPKSWLPPLIGPAVVESETRKQYREFIAEIERRGLAAKGP